MENKNLKKEIYNLVVKYYNENHKIKPFIPGETYIPYAGRIYNLFPIDCMARHLILALTES